MSRSKEKLNKIFAVGISILAEVLVKLDAFYQYKTWLKPFISL